MSCVCITQETGDKAYYLRRPFYACLESALSWRIVCSENEEIAELLNPTSLEYSSRRKASRDRDTLTASDSLCPIDGHHCRAVACQAKLHVVSFPPNCCRLG